METPSCFLKIQSAGRIFCGVFLLNSALLHGQIPIVGSGPHGSVNVFNTDLAVLETGDVRKDLPCTVTPSKPVVGFDLKFHTGYEVTVPLKELAGSDNMLTILFRVTPQGKKDELKY